MTPTERRTKTDPPTEPGWYWARETDCDPHPIPVYVFEDFGRLRVVAFREHPLEVQRGLLATLLERLRSTKRRRRRARTHSRSVLRDELQRQQLPMEQRSEHVGV